MDHAQQIAEICARHAGREGALLPILNDIQGALGCIDDAAERLVAAALNLSRADVHGVVSFYHDYRATPATKPVIRVCGAEACQARGCAALFDAGRAQDRVTVETVYCLGLCSVGPNAMLGDVPHARLNAARFSALIEGL